MLKSVASLWKTLSIVVLNSLVLTAIVFVTGEFWVRSGIGEADRPDRIWEGNQQGTYHPWAGFRNTPGYEYVIGNLKMGKINRFGWRGPEPTIAKPAGVRRALLFGDSVAFSSLGCREGATLHGALKRALETRTRQEWEVINMAVPGGFSSISLGTLAHEGIHFDPDVVVTLNGNNDLALLRDGVSNINLGLGHFEDALYHRNQSYIDRLYDPRTGGIDGKLAIGGLLSRSAFLKKFVGLGDSAENLRYAYNLRRWNPHALRVRPEDNEHLLKYFVNNQRSMSYISRGKGAVFITFLQPYLSLRHKKIGPRDREAIASMTAVSGAGLMEWMDDAYPLLSKRLQQAAREDPGFIFEDLSLMFTDEQVFLDLVHMHCERFTENLGNTLMAARMADRIIETLYKGQPLPDWRKLTVDGAPHNWNEFAYLEANPDVTGLIAAGRFANGYEHYRKSGFFDGREGGFPRWNENDYLARNPNVVRAIARGEFASGYDHYLTVGRAEGRRTGLPLAWTEGMYLALNPDVAKAVRDGKYASGQAHYRKIGVGQNRGGGFSGWDERGYLLFYQDVLHAVENGAFRSGLDHFLKAGKNENRQIKLGTFLARQ